jgi:hypothetical protein
MNHPHLTDDDVAQLPLAGARAVLLEEIMSTPTLVRTRTPQAHRRVRRAIASLGAAAAVAAVITGTFVVTNDARTTPKQALRYPAAAIAAAESNPRLALDMPGWKITEVAGFAKTTGSVTYSDGPLSIELTWYDASDYASFYDERTIESAEPVRAIDVAGREGILVTFRPGEDFEVVLEPEGDSFVGLRAQAAWNGMEQFKDVLSHVQVVTVDEWLARMPASVVSPVNAAAAVEGGLDGVPLAPGTTVEDYARLVGVNQTDSFYNRLAGEVACAWIEAWGKAHSARDDQAADAAISALEGAETWPVVKDMGAGYFTGSVDWVLTDLRAGRLPPKDNDLFGCV